jgi:hypothetical protein
MIMNARVVGHIVGKKSEFLTRGDPSDLETAERNAAVASAVNMGVTAGTRYQMQAAVAEATFVRTLPHLGVEASLFAQIAGPDQPDPAEIGVKDPDDPIGDDLELGLERGRREKGVEKIVKALLPVEGFQPFLLRPLAFGDVNEKANVACATVHDDYCGADVGIKQGAVFAKARNKMRHRQFTPPLSLELGQHTV